MMIIKITRQILLKRLTSSKQNESIGSHRPFEYHFMDEDFNKMYDSELRAGKII